VRRRRPHPDGAHNNHSGAARPTAPTGRVGLDKAAIASSACRRYRQITAHNHASSANPLLSPEGLATVAQMLAAATITARVHATAGLDAAGQVLDELRRGGLRGKAIIRL
jgi:hypothetical protein